MLGSVGSRRRHQLIPQCLGHTRCSASRQHAVPELFSCHPIVTTKCSPTSCCHVTTSTHNSTLQLSTRCTHADLCMRDAAYLGVSLRQNPKLKGLRVDIFELPIQDLRGGTAIRSLNLANCQLSLLDIAVVAEMLRANIMTRHIGKNTSPGCNHSLRASRDTADALLFPCHTRHRSTK